MNTNLTPTTRIRYPLVLAALLALPLTFAVGCEDEAEPVATPPAAADDHEGHDHEGHDEDEADHPDHDDHEHGDATPLPIDFNTPTPPPTAPSSQGATDEDH